MKIPSISEKFKELRKRKEGAYMPYVCCGDPDVKFTVELVETLCKNGADIVELGIPFSDPIADGPTIQEAGTRALSSGMTPIKALETVSELRKRGISIPIVLMTYYNLILHAGVDSFLEKAKKAGVQGIVVPDVPFEESETLRSAGKKYGIDAIQFVAPTTSEERMEKILKNAQGFIYAVSVTGITGARKEVGKESLELIGKVKKHSKIPVALGFGISEPLHAMEAINAGADGVIEGSNLVKIYSSFLPDGKKALAEIGRHAFEMKKALLK